MATGTTTMRGRRAPRLAPRRRPRVWPFPPPRVPLWGGSARPLWRRFPRGGLRGAGVRPWGFCVCFPAGAGGRWWAPRRRAPCPFAPPCPWGARLAASARPRPPPPSVLARVGPLPPVLGLPARHPPARACSRGRRPVRRPLGRPPAVALRGRWPRGSRGGGVSSLCRVGRAVGGGCGFSLLWGFGFLFPCLLAFPGAPPPGGFSAARPPVARAALVSFGRVVCRVPAAAGQGAGGLLERLR